MASVVSIVLGLHPGLIEHRRPHDGLSDRIGVAVGCWPPILEVAVAVLADLARDADAGTSVGHASRELEDVGCLVVAGEPPGVVPAAPWIVDADVVVVPLAQLLNGSFDVSVGEENGVGLVSMSIWGLFPLPPSVQGQGQPGDTLL